MKLATKPVLPEDVYELSWIEDPRVSPDGKWIAFVRAEIDKGEDKYRRSIWLAAADGKTSARKFTTSGKSDSSPRWSPDGKRLAFVSARNGRPQIYLIALSGGEATQLTDMPTGATSPEWSPDGKWIAFASSLSADERKREARGEFPPSDPTKRKAFFDELKQSDEKKSDPRVISRLPYRTGTDFLDNRPSHLYVIEANEDATPRRVTDGDWNFDPPTWSADGAYLYSGAAPNPRADESELEHDLVRVRVRDGKLEWLNEKDFVTFGALPSPDGRWLAYFRNSRKNPASELTYLVVKPLRGRGAVRSLTDKLDRSTDTARWSADGRAIYFNLHNEGRTEIYRANPASGKTERVVGGIRVAEFFDTNGTTLAFGATTAQKFSDLYVATAQGRNEKRLTKFNDAYESTHQILKHNEFWYNAPDGRKIQGWIIYPPNFNPRRKYPLLLEIHGGPHAMWAPGTRTMWHEWQVMANHGYVVFYCNPRGSDGYGKEFFGVIKENWGDADAPDILAGVDAVTKRGFIDTNRMAITGGSYGGFMTTWIIGHDQRFKAAFAQRGVYNLISFHGTTDFNHYWDFEFGGPPWENFDAHWKHSPLAYVKNIRTPLIIKHSDQDYRAPISDAEQLFVALRKLKRTVQFIRYPREGHELSRSGEPKHRVDRMQRMLAWFDKYCQKGKQQK